MLCNTPEFHTAWERTLSPRPDRCRLPQLAAPGVVIAQLPATGLVQIVWQVQYIPVPSLARVAAGEPARAQCCMLRQPFHPGGTTVLSEKSPDPFSGARCETLDA